MATVTKSIGTSVSPSRDYSTITAWEADLDNVAIYSAGDDAVGECYNDSVFNEEVTINGGGTVGLSSLKLTVPESERHDGTAGSGARNVHSGGSYTGGHCISIDIDAMPNDVTIEWLEMANANNHCYRGCICSTTSEPSGGVSKTLRIRHNLCYHTVVNARNSFGIHIGHHCLGGSTSELQICNNIIFDIKQNTTGDRGDLIGIKTGYWDTVYVCNNTIWNIDEAHASSTADLIGIMMYDAGAITEYCRNNVVMDVQTNGSGPADCFESFSNVTDDHNLSSDATAAGTGSLTNKSASDQFESIISSIDLHLKSGADAINAGTDLGTTPSGVEIDIDGRDRDSEGDTWDMGADEYVVASGNIKTINSIVWGNVKTLNSITVDSIKELQEITA